MNNFKKVLGAVVVLAGTGWWVGCGAQPESGATTESKSAAAPIDTSPYLLQTPPGEVQQVLQARESAKDGEPVTVVGRIGGSVDPWVESRAAFSIVDLSIPSCLETKDDQCPTPWDYCCKLDDLAGGTALVKIVDDQKQLLKAGAKNLFSLTELQKVTLVGTASRDDAGNLTILATSIFVHPGLEQ